MTFRSSTSNTAATHDDLHHPSARQAFAIREIRVIGTAATVLTKAELDDLLDEIDEVLETNAEDFVKSYIQKGGQ